MTYMEKSSDPSWYWPVVSSLSRTRHLAAEVEMKGVGGGSRGVLVGGGERGWRRRTPGCEAGPAEEEAGPLALAVEDDEDEEDDEDGEDEDPAATAFCVKRMRSAPAVTVGGAREACVGDEAGVAVEVVSIR